MIKRTMMSGQRSDWREPGSKARLFLAVAVGLFGTARAQNILQPNARQMSAPPTGSDSRLSPPDAPHVANTGDYFLLADGREVHLSRVQNEVAVRYGAGVAPDDGLGDAITALGTQFDARLTRANVGRVATDILHCKTAAGTAMDKTLLTARPCIAHTFPVLMDPDSGSRMIPTDEILIRLREPATSEDAVLLANTFGLSYADQIDKRLNVFTLKIKDSSIQDVMALSRQLAKAESVVWAEPDFIREIHFSTTPNDALFSLQQNMHNTGQNGATSDADLDAPEAWNITAGNSGVVIAIIDTGVDTAHSDLRIDGRGYDFYNGDSDASPVSADGHGTACAGVAAAIGNNAYRVAGVASGCTILPIKVSETNAFASSQVLGQAISYAAGYADVISCSWGGGSSSSYINDGISDAVINGRSGKGCPVFFASGNAASAWGYGGSRTRLSLSSLSAGSYYVGFTFYSYSSSYQGAIDDVCLLGSDGYTHQTSILPTQSFEGSTFPPSGWSTSSSVYGGTAAWSRSSVSAKTGTTGTYSARTPSLSSGYYSQTLLTPLLSISGTETLAFDTSLRYGAYGKLYVTIFNSSMTSLGYFSLSCLPYSTTTALSYPSSFSNSIAVGACTDCDRRSNYSQYGTGLEFVAPSNGGYNDVPSLDPSGSIGWETGDYMMRFGGTSCACPEAAGVAALVLSVNPNLTRNQVRYLMRKNCDKIGGVTYSGGDTGCGGWNTYYGYGRLNAYQIVSTIPASESVSTPTSIAGTSSAIVGKSASLSASGSLSNLGDTPIEYRFDWGDGATSAWGSASQTHIWSRPGTFALKCQAHCGAHTSVTSSWSETLLSVSASQLTLTVISAHGGVTPGTLTTNYNVSVSHFVTNSPVANGATQRVCVGASVVGNAFAQNSATNVSLTLTNNATLTWLWRTNYWLATAAGAHGSVSVGPGWQALGATTQLTASADQYYHLGAWTGDAGGADNPLSLLIDRPKSVTATFAADMTSTHPTPHAWLARYGIVSDFEQAAQTDADSDGMAAWQEYVAGTVPTNAASVFAATLLTSNGLMSVHWTPDLTNADPARVYSVYGTPDLLSGFPAAPFTNVPAGSPVPLQALSTNRFFKVGVEVSE